MAELKTQLQDDLTQAMRERDAVTAATIRMALTAITNAEVSGKEHRDLTDDDVIEVLTSQAKKRREAAAAYVDAGRPDRAEAEEAELAVLQRYLPAQLGAEEISELVREAVAEAEASGATGGRAMGQVMKSLQPKIAGRADGAQVAAEVKSQLGIG